VVITTVNRPDGGVIVAEEQFCPGSVVRARQAVDLHPARNRGVCGMRAVWLSEFGAPESLAPDPVAGPGQVLST
jgi:hypothetical protein